MFLHFILPTFVIGLTFFAHGSATVVKARAYMFQAVDSPDHQTLQPIGHIDFTEVDSEKVQVTGSLKGIPFGSHGFHVHEFGDIGNQCGAAGPHFNPQKVEHGAPNEQIRHVGDLGNIRAEESGQVEVNVVDSFLKLNGPHSIIGRALVLHEKFDDLGWGSDAESKKTGNAGKRISCGIIGILDE